MLEKIIKSCAEKSIKQEIVLKVFTKALAYFIKSNKGLSVHIDKKSYILRKVINEKDIRIVLEEDVDFVFKDLQELDVTERLVH